MDQSPPVSEEILKNCEWKDVVESQASHECHRYSEGFFAAAEASNDLSKAGAFRLLGAICSMSLRSGAEHVSSPLGPCSQ